MKIPQLYYLRKIVVKRKDAGTLTLFVYRNYRNTRQGVVDVTTFLGDQREFAKCQVLKREPEAEFRR